MAVTPPLRGELRWALVPYDFEAPFAGDEWSGGLDFAGISALLRERGPRPQFAVNVPAKVRPILVVQSLGSGIAGTVAVLRTKRLSALPERLRESIRRNDDPRLVYLPEQWAGAERVVLVDAVHRLHNSAIDGQALGRTSDDVMRLVAERLVRALELDLSGLVEREAAATLARLATD